MALLNRAASAAPSRLSSSLTTVTPLVLFVSVVILIPSSAILSRDWNFRRNPGFQSCNAESARADGSKAAIVARGKMRADHCAFLADNFEDEIAFLDGLLGDTEGIFDQLGRLLEVGLGSVVQTAEDGARFDLLADFDLENNADSRIDAIFLCVASGSNHGRSLTDQFGVDGADVSAAAGRNLVDAGRVGQQLEVVQNLGISSLRRNHFVELAIAGAVEQFCLCQLAAFIQRFGDPAQVDHSRR